MPKYFKGINPIFDNYGMPFRLSRTFLASTVSGDQIFFYRNFLYNLTTQNRNRTVTYGLQLRPLQSYELEHDSCFEDFQVQIMLVGARE